MNAIVPGSVAFSLIIYTTLLSWQDIHTYIIILEDWYRSIYQLDFDGHL